MNRLRRIATALWLSLALLAGQHAVGLHALAHAAEQLAPRKDTQHVPASCDKCFACAELSSAAGPSIPSVPVVPTGASLNLPLLEPGAPCAPRLAFRSRAPPTLP